MLLWYFSRISSVLLQKLLALIPPWKDFHWPPRLLNVRKNLEESNHCRLLVWNFGYLPPTATQYQPLCPRNKNQNWDNFVVCGKRSLSEAIWDLYLLSTSLSVVQRDWVRRPVSRKEVSVSTRWELQALVCNLLVSGSQVLPRELVVMPTGRERALFLCC